MGIMGARASVFCFSYQWMFMIRDWPGATYEEPSDHAQSIAVLRRQEFQLGKPSVPAGPVLGVVSHSGRDDSMSWALTRYCLGRPAGWDALLLRSF